MMQLLKSYSISQILIFVVILAIAIKGVISFFDWAKDRVTKHVHENDRPNIIQDRLNRLQTEQQSLTNSLTKIGQKLDMLIDSDRDDIKAYITQKHHHFIYKKGYIDDYTMNILQQRYNHYKDEGGNSFIRSLMDELRALPKQNFNTIIEKSYNK